MAEDEVLRLPLGRGGLDLLPLFPLRVLAEPSKRLTWWTYSQPGLEPVFAMKRIR